MLFDEFHERSLDADLGLALALDAQARLREDLRILVMSATLDGARVARLLGERAADRERRPRLPGRDALSRPRSAGADRGRGRARRARSACRETGSILVFLPGQGEIRRVAADARRARSSEPTSMSRRSIGAMDSRAQDRAVEPAPPGRRKIVLATSIAETSLTIEGVRVVIDSGLARVPRYEPDIGLTRLETVRVVAPAADQRRGRAGRIEPGVCYRLWEEAATGGARAFRAARNSHRRSLRLPARLRGLGRARPGSDLAFLDPPPRAALTEARALLVSLGALDADGAHHRGGPGDRARSRCRRGSRGWSSMRRGAARRSWRPRWPRLLTERGLGGDGVDLATRIERFRRDRSPARAEDARRLARACAAGRRGRRRRKHEAEHAAAPSRRGLSRPYRQGARQARRISYGEWPRGGARAA